MTHDPKKPFLRKPLGVLLIVLLVALYAMIVTTVAAPILRLPALIQAPAWLVLGIAWVFPLRPLVRWMEIGHFRK